MNYDCPEQSAVAYRNFNLCPHCAVQGRQGLLDRLCEGLPMISRSDGVTFHLVLADRPLPYPIERAAGPARKISACFWYSHVVQPDSTYSTVVILPDHRTNHPTAFRLIETAADLLAEELLRFGRLATVYEYFDTPPLKVAV